MISVNATSVEQACFSPNKITLIKLIFEVILLGCVAIANLSLALTVHLPVTLFQCRFSPYHTEWQSFASVFKAANVVYIRVRQGSCKVANLCKMFANVCYFYYFCLFFIGLEPMNGISIRFKWKYDLR